MPMTQEMIDFAIRDRLIDRWGKFMSENGAAPVCVFAVKQLPGPDYATPVVCMIEEMTDEQVLVIAEGIAREIRRRIKGKRHGKESPGKRLREDEEVR